jgi:hypothetical protein
MMIRAEKRYVKLSLIPGINILFLFYDDLEKPGNADREIIGMPKAECHRTSAYLGSGIS